MKKILKTINWFFIKPRLEKNLLRYCEIEFRPSDITAEYTNLLDAHKRSYLGGL